MGWTFFCVFEIVGLRRAFGADWVHLAPVVGLS